MTLFQFLLLNEECVAEDYVLLEEHSAAEQYARPETSESGLCEHCMAVVDRLRTFFELYMFPARLTNFKRAVVHVYTQANISGRGRAKPRTRGVGAPPAGGATALDLWGGGVLRVGGAPAPGAGARRAPRAPGAGAARATSGTLGVADLHGLVADAAGDEPPETVRTDTESDDGAASDREASRSSSSDGDGGDAAAARGRRGAPRPADRPRPRPRRPGTPTRLRDALFSYAHAADALVVFKARPRRWRRGLERAARARLPRGNPPGDVRGRTAAPREPRAERPTRAADAPDAPAAPPSARRAAGAPTRRPRSLPSRPPARPATAPRRRRGRGPPPPPRARRRAPRPRRGTPTRSATSATRGATRPRGGSTRRRSSASARSTSRRAAEPAAPGADVDRRFGTPGPNVERRPARSARSRRGRCSDGSIALLECSTRGERARSTSFDDARMEAGSTISCPAQAAPSARSSARSSSSRRPGAASRTRGGAGGTSAGRGGRHRRAPQAQGRWRDATRYTRLQLDALGGAAAAARPGAPPRAPPAGPPERPGGERDARARVRLLNDLGKCHLAAGEAAVGAGKECEIPNFKGSSLGRFPLVSADFWTSDHLSERSRSMDAFSGTRARGTLMLKRT